MILGMKYMRKTDAYTHKLIRLIGDDVSGFCVKSIHKSSDYMEALHDVEDYLITLYQDKDLIARILNYKGNN